MSNYTKSTNFATKDNLPTGDPLKIVKGTEIDTEFNNIATAISTKTDNASAAITGGSITGITDLAIADGGTGASTATAAINNLLPSQTSNANKYLQTDGTNVSWDAISINTGDITGTLPVANGGTGVTSSTGTGSVVLSNSPTLVTPSLGAATASTLDVSGNVTLSGGTANSIPYLNGSKVVTTGAELYFNGTNLGVGTSASYRVDLGSATSDDAAVGIRIGRGGSSTTWSLIDNVGGSGNYRQYSSGTPTLRWLTSTDGSSWSEQMRLNATGLGVGNNNPAAKLDVTGSALVSGSVTATSFAGALNGTVGATTPTTGAFTTIAASSSVTLSGGTANGVTYLNGSKQLVSGSALTFDGTTLTSTQPTSFTPNATFVQTASTGGVAFVKVQSSTAEIDLMSGGVNWATNYMGADEAGLVTQGADGMRFNVGGSYARWTFGASEQMRLTSTGLGIGTSSPAYKLDVVAANNAKALQISGATTGYSYATINNTTTKVVLGVTDSTGTLFSTKLSSTYHIGLGTDNGYGLAFATNDVERVFIDSAGNLCLGVTPSAWKSGAKAFQLGATGYASLNEQANGSTSLNFNCYESAANTWTYYVTGVAPTRYTQLSGAHAWFNAPSGTAGNAISFTQAMTLDASGNLGVGTTSPTSGFRLDLQAADAKQRIESTTGTNSVQQRFVNSSGTFYTAIDNSTGSVFGTAYAAVLWHSGNYPMVFATNNTERARIDSSGNLLVGDTTSGTVRLRVTNSASDDIALFKNSNATPYGVNTVFSGASPNNTTSYFYNAVDSGPTTRFKVYSNGGIANYSANNVNLSDQRVKTDIQDAGGYLAKICAIPVRTFKYKDQTDDLPNLGVIAQEVEAVAPELVDTTGFGETPDDGVPLKAIYQTDLQYALMKALQELKAEFDAYKASHP